MLWLIVSASTNAPTFATAVAVSVPSDHRNTDAIPLLTSGTAKVAARRHRHIARARNIAARDIPAGLHINLAERGDNLPRHRPRRQHADVPRRLLILPPMLPLVHTPTSPYPAWIEPALVMPPTAMMPPMPPLCVNRCPDIVPLTSTSPIVV